MIEQIKSSEIKKFIEKNPKTVLLDVRTEDEQSSVGKPVSDTLGIKTYFITIGQDPSFVESVKKEKPDTIKGEFIKNTFITSSMGISYKVGAK